jgi:hypothetical protein
MQYQKSPAAAVFTWTGFYGGAEGIYGFGGGGLHQNERPRA